MTCLPNSLDHKKYRLALEYTLIFLVIPVVLFFFATRWTVHGTLWLVSLYALALTLSRNPPSWHILWHGTEWPVSQRKACLARFLASTALLMIITGFLFPERLFNFPLHHPWFWVLVMVLYPVLSVLPQEFVFRSFFFRRYDKLFSQPRIMFMVNAFSFGFIHLVFHNLVSPFLCLLAGGLFAHSYQQHRALKWAVLEHAAYGCMVFTVGLGSYFLVGGMPH